MFGEKVPEVAYKKGMGETEQASPPHGPPAKKSNRRCIIISAVSAVLVVILLIVIVYFSLAPSSDNMSSLVSRLRNAVCDLPPEVGPCRAHFENLHWDPSTKSCKVFVYGGCVGNDNNFQTEEECLALCGDNPVLNKCPERFLDPETDECTLAVYLSGFRTTRCIIISHVSAVLVVILLIVIVYFSLAPSSDNMSSLVSRLRNAVCDLPPEVGPCRAHFENLHWDPSTKSCKKECLALCGDNPVLNKCPERFLDPETDECTLTEAKVAEVEASRPSSTSACPEGQSRGQDGVCA
ncbi:unnamed protein product [Cyprideis torosa]|uniref:Uncharacterized protein n=1 Tax=Cyprideis torosa TaxID=163714 RepID=A0A7R8WB43_9CRUS|nr:unnamed protein product [Cyprideis torosa]CAG0889109.1 unnamed protein product [Cyprideis torosa]